MRNGKTKLDETESWTPPRGIRFFDLPNRPDRPFAVQWRVSGQVKTKTFSKKHERLAFGKSVAGDIESGGITALRLDPDEAREWRAFRAQLGEVPLDAVLACWRKYGSAVEAASPLVSELVPRYMAFRAGERSWGDSAARHAQTQLERFVEVFGSRRIASIQREEIREWLGKLRDGDGQLIGPHGVKDHRKNVHTFFGYCVRERWGLVLNECEHVVPPKTDDGDPEVIAVRDAFAFFRANRDERLIGRIALEAFGFVRTGTAARITLDALDFDRRGVRMAASIHKTGKKDGRSRYRQGQPDNLWAWLKHAPEKCWEMTPLEYREAKRHAFIRAGLRPYENATEADAERIGGLRNIWRHSAISYHLACYQNPNLTQRLAQHASYKQTEEYEGLAAHDDAARYFSITPESVSMGWEAFAVLPVLPAHER